MKVRLLWVAWGAVAVMAVVVLVGAFAANEASDPGPGPAPAVVHHDLPVLPEVADPGLTYRPPVAPRRRRPLPRIAPVAGGTSPVAVSEAPGS